MKIRSTTALVLAIVLLATSVAMMVPPPANGPAIYGGANASAAYASTSTTPPAEVTPTPEPGIPTNCNLSCSSATIGYGGSYTIRGTLASGGVPMVNVVVYLEKRTPKTEFVATQQYTRTDFGGQFSLTVRPQDMTYYRVAYGGGAGYAATSSAEVYVKPRAYLSTPYAASTLRRARAFTTYGYLKPKHMAGSYIVQLQFYRLENNKWVLRKKANARSYNYYGYTKYQIATYLSSSGKWRFRAYHNSVAHAPTYSGWRYTTVK